MHPYFANLDKKSLPAVGEEYIGLPVGKIPPDYAELFNALINIEESNLEEEGDECWKEAEETPDKMVASSFYFCIIRRIHLLHVVVLLAL